MSRLKPGDVLVFKAAIDENEKTIAWLADSDLRHSAMMLTDELMVEIGANGICVSRAKELDGDEAVLLRLCSEKDTAPLINAAQKYIDCETRCDLPPFVFLAGHIVYSKIKLTPKFVTISDVILRSACMQLDKLIWDDVFNNSKKAIVCSQLVYQIYEDCGKGYHIEINNGLPRAASSLDMADGRVCLAELACDAPELDMSFSASGPEPDSEELAKKLYLALTEQQEESDMDFAADLGELPSWTKRFLEKLEEFLEKSKSNIPLNALFISPADLAYRSTNLRTVCKLNIAR